MRNICVSLLLLAGTAFSSASAETVDALLSQAQQLHKSGKDKEAIEKFSLVLEREPKNTSALFERAICKNEVHDLSASVADYSRYLELRKDKAGFYNRGLIYMELQDFKSALEDFSETIKLDANFGRAYYDRGKCFLILKDFGAAIGDNTRAIELNAPMTGWAYNNRAVAKQHLGDHKGAIKDFSESMKLLPANAAPYINRAASKNALNDFAGALADLQTADRLKPNDPLIKKQIEEQQKLRSQRF